MPVVLVFTKFDLLVSKIAGGDSQQHERAKVEAERKYEESCHLILRKQPRDVPAEIVSSTCSPVWVAWNAYLTLLVVFSEPGT